MTNSAFKEAGRDWERTVTEQIKDLNLQVQTLREERDSLKARVRYLEGELGVPTSIDEASPRDWDLAAARVRADEEMLERAIRSAEVTADNLGREVYIVEEGGVFAVRTADRFRAIALEIITPREFYRDA